MESNEKATVILENLLKDTKAFQYIAILHEDRVTGMRDNRRDFAFRSRSAVGTAWMPEPRLRRDYPLTP